MAGEKFPLPLGPAGEWQGMATAEPQGRLRARNPAPGFLKNAAAKAPNAASLTPRSKINAIMPRAISHGYGNLADGKICDPQTMLRAASAPKRELAASSIPRWPIAFS
jgi:hypothetical protein